MGKKKIKKTRYGNKKKETYNGPRKNIQKISKDHPKGFQKTSKNLYNLFFGSNIIFLILE